MEQNQDEPRPASLDSPRLFKVDTEELGSLSFRCISYNDFIQLKNLLTDFSSDRELASHFIHNQIESPALDIEAIDRIEDGLLIVIAEQVFNKGLLLEPHTQIFTIAELRINLEKYILQLNDQLKECIAEFNTLPMVASSFIKSMPIIKPPILPLDIGQFVKNLMQGEEFKQAMNLGLESARQGMSDIARTLAESVSIVTQSVQQVVSQSMGQLQSTIPEIGRIISNIPEMGKVYEYWELAARSLEEIGVEYTFYFWSDAFLLSLINIKSPMIEGVALKKILDVTRGGGFHESLGTLFKKSTVLRRRWKIVEEALSAHQKRRYALSIPVFIAQIEGTMADIFILKDVAVRRGNKLYLKDNDGNLKKGKNGKDIEIKGIGTLVGLSKRRNDEIFEFVVGSFVDELVGERHAILHGNKLDYEHARLSVKLVLLLFVLANEVVYFETGDTHTIKAETC